MSPGNTSAWTAGRLAPDGASARALQGNASKATALGRDTHMDFSYSEKVRGLQLMPGRHFQFWPTHAMPTLSAPPAGQS